MFSVFKRLTSGAYTMPKASHKNLLEEIVHAEFKKSMSRYAGQQNPDTWYYLNQPNGSQKFPDFQIRFNEFIYDVECKSSQNGKPIWNCSFPQLECYYIFMRLCDGAIAVYRGDELISREMYTALTEIKNSAEIKELESKICARLADVESATRFSYYIRDMFVQHTPIQYTRMNKFSHISKNYTASSEHRHKMGQFFTGENIKKYIRSRICDQEFATCLEPSFGSGELLDILCDLDTRITGYELEPILCQEVTKVCDINVRNTDFLLDTSTDTYDLILANPPYNELNKCENYERYQVIYDHWIENKSNIYFLFMKRCIDLLNQGGTAIFIIPNTFKMSTSCERIRKYILGMTDIIDVKNFGKFSREVAQDVMCITLRKQSSTGLYTCRVGQNLLISDNREPAEHARSIRDLGVIVKIGKIVWNQHKESLCASGGVLLLYSANLSGQNIVTISKSDRQYINTDPKNIASTPCLLMRRSVTGANNYVPICYKLTKPAAIENHIFTIHGPKKMLNQAYSSLTDPRTGVFIKSVIGSTHLSIENVLDLPLYLSI